MRPFAILTSISTCLLICGFFLLRLGEEHISSGHDELFKFAEGLGLFMLFAALIAMVIAYAQLSRKLVAWKALALGLATMTSTLVVMQTLTTIVNVHSWTFSLLVLPLILLLSGAVAVVVSLFRLLKKHVAVQ